MKLTSTQKAILNHLLNGGRVNRRDHSLSHVYDFVPKRSESIQQRTLFRMRELGLILVASPPEGGATTYLITERGRREVAPTTEEKLSKEFVDRSYKAGFGVWFSNSGERQIVVKGEFYPKLRLWYDDNKGSHDITTTELEASYHRLRL